MSEVFFCTLYICVVHKYYSWHEWHFSNCTCGGFSAAKNKYRMQAGLKYAHGLRNLLAQWFDSYPRQNTSSKIGSNYRQMERQECSATHGLPFGLACWLAVKPLHLHVIIIFI